MYLAMRTLHVLAVVLFLGNVITGLFWKAHGDRTADPRIISHTLQGIIRSDRWFALPGVLLIITFGVSAAVIGRLPLLGTDWIRYSVILFGVSGLAFMLQVAPLGVLGSRGHPHAAGGPGPDGPQARGLICRALSRTWL